MYPLQLNIFKIVNFLIISGIFPDSMKNGIAISVYRYLNRKELGQLASNIIINTFTKNCVKNQLRA